MIRISSVQRGYILHWLRITIIAELILFLLPSTAVIIFVFAASFLIGFILRVFKKYPGKDEPLVLDVLGVIFAIILALVSINFLASKVIIMLLTPVIILPHIIYILVSRDLKQEDV